MDLRYNRYIQIFSPASVVPEISPCQHLTAQKSSEMFVLVSTTMPAVLSLCKAAAQLTFLYAITTDDCATVLVSCQGFGSPMLALFGPSWLKPFCQCKRKLSRNYVLVKSVNA